MPSKPSVGEQVTVRGTVERVVFANPDSQFGVLLIEPEEPLKVALLTPVAVVGSLAHFKVGDRVLFEGAWQKSPKHGWQVKVESCVHLSPNTLEGLKRFLASEHVEGVGPELAARLVERFGMTSLQVIEEEPERLREVEGIGPQRARKLSAAWKRQRGIRDIMVFLQGHGVSPRLAWRIFKHYGVKAVGWVKENPYRLADEIRGIGFAGADRIARSVGVPLDSPLRAAAGLLYVLGKQEDAGHCFCPRPDLLQAAEEVLGIDPGILERAMSDLVSSGDLVVEQSQGEDPAVYPELLYRTEVAAAASLARLANARARSTAPQARAMEAAEQGAGVRLSGLQRKAVGSALASRVTVITGGPGTGKTTIIRAVVAGLTATGRYVLLAAPTGRAARRLAEATGLEARTVHRLLEYTPRQQRFARCADNLLRCDCAVVDEASMMDVRLFASLLDALPTGSQLVLVGDVDQLPSVGPGNVLGDVIRSGAATVQRLSEIFRQAERSLIIDVAHEINAGTVPDPPEARKEDLRDFYFVVRPGVEECAASVEELVCDRIPARFGMDPFTDIQVLAPMHRGDIGVKALNARLQQVLNGQGDELVHGGGVYRQGDRVMQLRNDYDKEVFNGDVGRILSIDRANRALKVRFDGRIVGYEAGELDQLTLAYAVSVHKSQGSEYPAVVIPLLTQHYMMLQRNLLYTAITRGRRLVILVGSHRALRIAVGNNRVMKRCTRLPERIQEAMTAR